MTSARVPRDNPHTIRFWMRLILARITILCGSSIDGRDVGQCFTTWENIYRAQPVPISDSLLFRSRHRTAISRASLGGGYLFDNVTTTTANGVGPPDLRPADRKAGRHAHGERRRPRRLPDHRPQPWPSRRPQRAGVRSDPARDDVRERRPQAASPRSPRCLLIRASRPANASASTPCSASMRTRRRARDNIVDETAVHPGLRPALARSGATAPARAGSASAGQDSLSAAQEGKNPREGLARRGLRPNFTG